MKLSSAAARRFLARRAQRRRDSRYPPAWAWGPGVRLEDAIASGVASVGRHTYGGAIVYVFHETPAGVRIGSFCSLGHDVRLVLDGNHRVDWVTTFPLRLQWGLPGALEDGHPAPAKGLAIGNDVWIGEGALILDGVTVGDGAVIAARSVVTKDVRPYGIVAGNPAHEVRRRFTDDQVSSLLAIRWWDWPDEVIRERVDELCGGGVDSFITAYGAPDTRSCH